MPAGFASTQKEKGCCHVCQHPCSLTSWRMQLFDRCVLHKCPRALSIIAPVLPFPVTSHHPISCRHETCHTSGWFLFAWLQGVTAGRALSLSHSCCVSGLRPVRRLRPRFDASFAPHRTSRALVPYPDVALRSGGLPLSPLTPPCLGATCFPRALGWVCSQRGLSRHD